MDLPHDIRALLPEFGPAAHVHCLQQRLRSERPARHWYDLAQLERSGFAEGVLRSRDIASQVAVHRQRFFRENGRDGEPISYREAVEGNFVLVPEGDARTRLAEDYHRTLSSGLLPTGAARFQSMPRPEAACRVPLLRMYHRAYIRSWVRIGPCEGVEEWSTAGGRTASG